MFKSDGNLAHKNQILKIMHMLQIMSCEMEISEHIRDEFTDYIQKVSKLNYLIISIYHYITLFKLDTCSNSTNL